MGLLAWVLRGHRLQTWAGVLGAVLGSLIGLVGTLPILLGPSPEFLDLPWSLPLATFSLGIDPLSAFFLLPTFGLSVEDIRPVDLYVPGHPPHPLTILDGLLRLLGRLEGR